MLSRHPVVPNTACQPFTRHSTLREKKTQNKTSQKHKIQSHSLEGQHQTSGDTHMMQTSPQHVWSLGSEDENLSLFYFHLQMLHLESERGHCLLQCVLNPQPNPTTSTLTTGTGQRLKRPTGGQSDTQTAVRGVLRFFCVFAKTVTSSPLTAGGHGLMRSLTDRVSADSESGTGVRGENTGVGGRWNKKCGESQRNYSLTLETILCSLKG